MNAKIKNQVKLVKSLVPTPQSIIAQESSFNGLINPPVDWQKIIKLGYTTYNLLCINIKMELLTQIKNVGNLKEKLPANLTPQKFLKKFLLSYEMLGNGFIEKREATSEEFRLYNVNTTKVKLDKDFNAYSVNEFDKKKINGYMLQKENLFSDYYGLPDWLALEDELNLYRFANGYNLRFFRTGGSPRKIIKFQNSEVNADTEDTIREFFASSFGGAYDTHNQTLVMATGETANAQASIEIEDLHKISDMSFEKLKEMSRDTTLALHLIPPRIAGIMSSGLAGGSEVREQLMMLNNLLVVPRKREIENFIRELGVEGFELHSLDTTTTKDDLILFTNLTKVTGDAGKAKQYFNEFKEENRE